MCRVGKYAILQYRVSYDIPPCSHSDMRIQVVHDSVGVRDIVRYRTRCSGLNQFKIPSPYYYVHVTVRVVQDAASCVACATWGGSVASQTQLQWVGCVAGRRLWGRLWVGCESVASEDAGYAGSVAFREVGYEIGCVSVRRLYNPLRVRTHSWTSS